MKLNRKRLFEIIQIGQRDDTVSLVFDIIVIVSIIANTVCMFLETFDRLAPYMNVLTTVETVTVIFFCVEYVLRLYTAKYLFPHESEPKAVLHYARSFDGIVDLCTILPFFFLSGFIAFRLLRVVRILRLFRINSQYDSFNVITSVLYEKRNQILSSTFIIMVLMFASSLGMYSVEHEAQPEVFKNAFSGIWWSMSTLLTVGYGDIYPITPMGRLMAIFITFLGVGVVAIPTGIISAGFVEEYSKISYLNKNTAPEGTFIIDVDDNHSWVGKTQNDLLLPKEMQIMYVRRNNENIMISKDSPFMQNDLIYIKYNK